jgi:hypothetical protein
MKVLEDRSISSATHEFVFEFVQFGTLTRPAVRRTVVVRAASPADAKKILRKVYPRSDQHTIKDQRELVPALA